MVLTQCNVNHNGNLLVFMHLCGCGVHERKTERGCCRTIVKQIMSVNTVTFNL